MRTCKYCGEEVSDTAKKCKHCGEWVDINCPYCKGEVSPQATVCPHCHEKLSTQNPTTQTPDTQNENQQMPEELNKFNWGVFLCSGLWGIFNGMPQNILILTLVLWFLCYIPFINFVACPVAFGLIIWEGMQGNKWAWAKNNRGSVSAFNAHQRKWVYIPLIIILVISIICVIAVMGLAATVSSY